MNATPLSVPALLALALKSARSAPGLERAMAAYQQRSYLEAQSMFLVAGRAGDANAQELLGFMYAIGQDLYPGVCRSFTAARTWFEIAARGGRPGAQTMHFAWRIESKQDSAFGTNRLRRKAWNGGARSPTLLPRKGS